MAALRSIAARRGITVHLHGPLLTRLAARPCDSYDYMCGYGIMDVTVGVLQLNRGREPCLGTRRRHFRSVAAAQATQPTRPGRVRRARALVAEPTSPLEPLRRPQGEAGEAML